MASIHHKSHREKKEEKEKNSIVLFQNPRVMRDVYSLGICIN